MKRGWSIRAELMAVILASTVVLGALCIVVSVTSIRNTGQEEVEHIKSLLMEERRNQLRDLVENAHSVMAKADFYETAQRALGDMRFGEDGKNFFFVVDTAGMFFVHPQNPGLVGKVEKGLTDMDGKPYIREIIDRAVSEGEGFIQYRVPDPVTGNPGVKLTRFKLFPGWDWIVCTGLHIDDIERIVDAKTLDVRNAVRRQTVLVTVLTVGLLALGLLASFFLATRRLVRPVAQLTLAAEKASLGEFDVPVDVRSSREMNKLAEAIDRLRTSLALSMRKLKEAKSYGAVPVKYVEDGGEKKPRKKRAEEEAASADGTGRIEQ